MFIGFPEFPLQTSDTDFWLPPRNSNVSCFLNWEANHTMQNTEGLTKTVEFSPFSILHWIFLWFSFLPSCIQTWERNYLVGLPIETHSKQIKFQDFQLPRLITEGSLHFPATVPFFFGKGLCLTILHLSDDSHAGEGTAIRSIRCWWIERWLYHHDMGLIWLSNDL